MFRTQLKTTLSLIFLCFVGTIFSQENQGKHEPLPKKIYNTNRITEAPKIDGLIDEAAWDAVEWGGDFTQWLPEEGAAPAQKTVFKIVYDDKYLYVAARCYDTEPDKIVKRMSRRDGFEGDWIEINIDSYHDLRTAFSFTISVAGVKGDEAVSQNGNNWDGSWNPIWYADTNVDEEGWTAEMKIPFTQLRFSEEEEMVWGLQMHRRNFRIEERSLWQRVPRDIAGWVSNFGELHGIKGIKPQKQLEIQPYVVAQTKTFEKQEGNPFATGKDNDLNFGVDGKVGVTNNLTLDFTINPDFGQVEADPSQIALDGFQLFFQEQRPFFVENKNIFDYRVTQSQAGGPYGRDNLFYSRRIGRQPQSYPSLNPGEYADVPDNTTILGAAKFSGKTRSGWNIGIMEAVTQKEFAEIAGDPDREEVVEPLTNYLVTRLQKEFNEANTFIGGIFTATNRDLDDTGIDFLHKSAYTAGVDFKHQWNNRTWYIAGNIVGSSVNGSEEAILNTQTAHRRYYQRVDAEHVEVDPTRTNLTGTGGTFNFGKQGGEHWNFETGFTWRSPGLEMNDLGFQRDADNKTHYTWVGYRNQQPFSIFRQARVNYNHWLSYNFDGDNTFLGFNLNAHAEFKNFWNLSTWFEYGPKDYSDNALRGGPLLRLPDFNVFGLRVSTDRRKKVSFNARASFVSGEDNAFHRESYGFGIRWVPINAFNISIDPYYNKNHQELQYVTNTYNGNDARYMNSSMDQETFGMSIRLNYTIKPNLTIQYYGQPFISNGVYDDFKYITNATAGEFKNRFNELTGNQITLDPNSGVYNVDEYLDGNVDYSFGNPNFSFIEFRSNLVARWEYIPGSEIFLVWSQGLTTGGDPMGDIFDELGDNVFGAKAENIFLIKATYRFIF